MTGLFTPAADRPEPRWRIEKEHADGTRELVAFVDDRWVDAWRAIGCIATEVPQWPWEEES